MKNNDETILEILQGHKTSRWLSPKTVKIFIASTKEDFKEERKILLEYVGPELQNYLEQHEIEVELVDMHFGSDDKEMYDPFLFEDHLSAIRSCHKSSRGYFFMTLIGDSYGPFLPPLKLEKDTFSSILRKAKELNIDTNEFCKWYQQNDGKYTLKDFRDCEDWKSISINIFNIFFRCITKLDENLQKKYSDNLQSTLERQFHYALGIAPGTARHVLNIFRNWGNKSDDDIEALYGDIPSSYCIEKLDEFCTRITTLIPEESSISFTVPWKDGGMDPEAEEHKPYLSKFKSQILNHLKQVLNQNIEEQPELKSRKKIVQENFEENISHLTFAFGGIKKDFTEDDTLHRIKNLLTTNSETRLSPILIYGNQGSGKTSLLQTIFREIDNWLPCRIFKIVRFAASTPQSSYNLELLRLMCQQICIALKLPEGFLPKDASFDPLYINKWFQSLLRNFEELDQSLAIFIDDIHMLNPLDFDIVSGLSWLPITLPKKVFIICTTGSRVEDLKLTPQQKDKFKNGETYMELLPAPPLNDFVVQKICDLEKAFTQPAIKKLFLLLSCTQYGLTELELLEILMPTSNIEVIRPENAEFNFSSLSSVLNKLDNLIIEKVLKGKLVIEWSHFCLKDLVVKHYQCSQDTLKTTHTELADFYFEEFCDKDDESEEADAPAPLLSEMRETPFKSTLYSDVIYSRRHIEEFWIHLLKSGDVLKLKSLCMCNYDFLLAALQTFSVSYLRCILKHVRCYLLDREIELVYYSIKMSTDILTRDTYQLGTQLITWLRPVNDSTIISTLVTSAMAWCDGFTLPLVVPMTDWLLPPLPEQSKIMPIQDVRLLECSPSGHHVVCVTDNDPQLWHIMTCQLIHTFKGHKSAIKCMTISKQSQYLLTGSEDLSIIVWDLKSLSIKLKIVEHIAPVLCITSALSNSVIVSGGDDSSIIISSLNTGKVIMKIDHHRGPVKSVKTTATGDILLSASEDYKVCLWSLETFTLLNTITFCSPIKTIDVSADSVFLLALCKDNNLYLRTSATGTKLHTLCEHKSRVTSICLTQDSSKAIVGCVDGKVHIYNVHNGKVEKTISNPGGEITAVRLTERDDFLLTGGSNRVALYPFRHNEIDNTRQVSKSKKKQNLQAHTGFLTCIDVSRDGVLGASGSSDNSINIWQLNNQELLYTLGGHTGAITSLNFAANGSFLCSGSEDKTVKTWSLSAGNLLRTFSGHQFPISCVYIFMDSTRIISSDKNDNLFVWNADNGSIMHSFQAPNKCIKVTNSMKYNVASNGDTTLRIWATSEDEKYVVNHSKEITCFVLTMDSQFIITGSKDMSLKVWQVAGGKLSQVLMGHTAAVTCVAVSVADKTQIISGSFDNNLIVWDINTGDDIHTLSAHLSYITCVKLSGDGTLAISGSDDKSIIIWDAKKGLQLTSLQMHLSVICIESTMDFSRIAILLKDSKYMPIICLHNTTAKFVKLPTYAFNEKNIMDNSNKPSAKRQMKRLLKKEVSLDTYTWQKKYAHLTSNLVIPAVDEKFKRRFSISASMEEISKLPQNQDSKGKLTKQPSLAQSQHFDQLEALWNKRSPPRRRLQQSLSKQSSLAESYNSSEEELG